MEPYAWLGAGAISLGLGVTVFTGAGAAAADETAGDSVSASTTSRDHGESSGDPTTTTAGDSDGTGAGAEESATNRDDADVTETTTSDTEEAISDVEPVDDEQEPVPEESAVPEDDDNGNDSASTHRRSDRLIGAEETFDADDAVNDMPSAPAVPDDDTVDLGRDSQDEPAAPIQQFAATDDARPEVVLELSPAPTASNSAAILNPAPIPTKAVSAFTPLLGGPTGPVESPLSWLVLAAARRHVGRTREDAEEPELLSARGITTAEVNTAPIATLDRQKSPNARTGKVTGNIAADDPDGDRLTYTGMTTAKGVVTVNSRGSFTYTPTAAARHAAAATGATDADKTDTFVVTVSDGNGGVAEVPITAAIWPANSAPSRVRSSLTTPDPLTGVVTGVITAADRDGDPATYTVSAPTNGTVEINADGTFTYTASEAGRTVARSTRSSDRDTFTVTVEDGHGGLKTVTVNPTIAPANTAPTAGTPTVGDPSSRSGAVKGVVGAVDAEADRISYRRATITTAKGKFTLNSSGRFTYTPTAAARHQAAAGVPGATTDTVTITATDRYGAVADIPLTVPVAPKNAAPGNVKFTVGQPDAATGRVTGTVTATDADGDALSFSGPSATAKGTLSVTPAGSFTFTPTSAARNAAAAPDAPAAAKTDTFTVTVTDGHGASISVPVTVTISAADSTPTLTPVATVSVGDTPVQGVVSPDGRYVYVVNMGDGSLSIVDTGSNAVVKTVTGVGDKPVDVAVSPDGEHVYVASQTKSGTFTTDGIGTVAIVDTTSRTVVKTVAVGRSPVAVAVSPDGQRVYVANEEPNVTGTGDLFNTGTVTVIATGTNTVLTTVEAGYLPADVAVSPDGTKLYVTNLGPSPDDPSGISVIDTATWQPVRHIAVGLNPNHLAVSPDGARVYATDWSNKKLWVVDTTTNSVTSSVAGPTEGVAISPDGLHVYAVQGGNNPDNSVAVIDTASSTIVTTTPLRLAWDVTVGPDGKRLYVISYDPEAPGAVTIFAVGRPSTGNQPPQVGTPGFTVTATDAVTGAVTGHVTVTDPDGDTLAYRAPAATNQGTVTVDANGSFTFTPSREARQAAYSTSGEDTATFTITAIDAAGATVPVSVTVPVAPNRAPTLSTTLGFDFSFDFHWYGATEDYWREGYPGKVTVNIFATDPDSDALSYTLTGQPDPAIGTVTRPYNNDNIFVFTPTPQARQNAWNTPATDTATFTVTVSDGQLSKPVAVTVPIPVQMSLPGLVAGDPALVAEIPFALEQFNGNSTVVSPDGRYLYVTGSRYDDGDGRQSAPVLPGSISQDDYASHPRIWVLDTVTKTVVGDIAEITPGGTPGGLAVVSPDGTRLYVTAMGYDDVMVYDTATYTKLRTLSVDGSSWDDDTGWSYTGNGLRPSRIFISPAGDRIHVLGDLHTEPDRTTTTGQLGLVTVPTAANSATTPVETPLGIAAFARTAMSPDGTWIYAAGQRYVAGSTEDQENIVAFVNSVTHEVHRVPLGDEFDEIQSVDVSADGTRLYVSIHDGDEQVVKVFDTSTRALMAEVPLGPGYSSDHAIVTTSAPGNAAYVARTGYRYAGLFAENTYEYGAVVSVVSSDNTVRDIPLAGDKVISAKMSPDGTRLYVIARDGSSDSLSVIDTATNALIDVASLGSYRSSSSVEMNFSSDGQRLFITGPHHNANRPYSDRVDDDVSSVLVVDTTKLTAPIVVEPPDPPDVPVTTSARSLSNLFDRVYTKPVGTSEGIAYEIVGEAQHPKIIIYIGGTDPSGLGTLDFFGLSAELDPNTNQPVLENVESYLTRQTKPEQLAIIDAIVDKAPGAEILLVGYSQGGMDAQNIAASGRYADVSTVVTFGSPIVSPGSADYNTIHLWDIRDNIAKLTFLPPYLSLHPEYRGYYNTASTYYHDGKDSGSLFQSRADVENSGLTLFDEDDDAFENSQDAIALATILYDQIQTGDSARFEQWYAIHANQQTYRDVAADFAAYFLWADDAEQKYGAAYHDVQGYFNQSFLDIPDGFQLINGVLIPTF